MNSDADLKPLILVIDDAPQNLALMDDLLSEQYRVKVAPNGERGLSIASGERRPDLILLDVMMPVMDGFEVIRRLKADVKTQDIPVIFLTAKRELEDERCGFELGAVDYITKPISPPILQARVATHIALKLAGNFLKDRNAYLEQEVIRRTEDARLSMEEARIANELAMMAMASIAEARDNETGNHILRTQHYVRRLAEHVRVSVRFSEMLDDEFIELLFKAAPLHDIGKVGIPDRILLKPGRLTADEFEIMKTHTTVGYEAINKAEDRVGKRVPVLKVAKEIALSHQEKWDGSGYPQGLSGNAIPLSARLMAVADVYDALISRRVYKEPMPHEKAMAIMLEGKGHHFDPDLLDGFVEISEDFAKIAERYQDTLEEMADRAATTQIFLGD